MKEVCARAARRLRGLSCFILGKSCRASSRWTLSSMSSIVARVSLKWGHRTFCPLCLNDPVGMENEWNAIELSRVDASGKWPRCGFRPHLCISLTCSTRRAFTCLRLLQKHISRCYTHWQIYGSFERFHCCRCGLKHKQAVMWSGRVWLWNCKLIGSSLSNHTDWLHVQTRPGMASLHLDTKLWSQTVKWFVI